MARTINFNPGPATLPLPALERAQRELLDIEGSGMSIIEHSHRGKVFEAIHNEALELTRELLEVPKGYSVLLLQGGASQQFAVVPMNLLKPGQSADYLVTGVWAKLAIKEGKILGNARAAANTEVDGRFVRVPTQSELELDPKAAYVHITTNNTIFGTQWHTLPDVGQVPLVADMSSDIMWRPLDVAKFGLIYAGAQKNLGPSGLVVVIVKDELVDAGRSDIPTIFQYRTHRDTHSLYHTPPTFSIYLYRNVLLEMKRAGGLGAVEKLNRAKADLLYQAIDARPDLYRAPVEKASRSTMNVVFNLPTEELEKEFLKSAEHAGMVGLKGHRLVGGIRVSIYNAAPIAWVESLVAFMAEFKRTT